MSHELAPGRISFSLPFSFSSGGDWRGRWQSRLSMDD
jgi:hypothetical protein